MSGHSINDIKFEDWVMLASTDPQKFEQLRHDKISAIIERTTGQRRQRLLGLQWRIDAIRNQHKNSATSACMAISELMWETFEHLSELLQAQVENDFAAPSASPQLSTPVSQANIIPFPVKYRKSPD